MIKLVSLYIISLKVAVPKNLSVMLIEELPGSIVLAGIRTDK